LVLALATAQLSASTVGMPLRWNNHVSSRLTSGLGRAGEGVYSARRKIATGAAALLALMVGYHVVFGQNGLIAYGSKRHDARELQVQMKDLQTENERLRGHVDRLTSDPGAIEHEAREALHYARPGEVIYTMPADRK
jgi:cell division protein FtsB